MCGYTLLQGFMRAFVVVMSQPAPGAPPLGGRCGCWWPGCFRFEFAMPLFVGAIICRSATPAVFHLDPQTKPPGTQPGKMGWSGAAKRPTLITMNCLRQAVTPEQPDELPTHTQLGTIRQNAHAQAVTTIKIPHGQRFATDAIGRTKVAFEIHRPYLVGAASGPKRWPNAYRSARAARAWLA